MALGYIAAFSETLAMTVIAEKGYLPVIDSIREDCEEHIKGAATWTLGQLGRHSTEHAKTISESGLIKKCNLNIKVVYVIIKRHIT